MAPTSGPKGPSGSVGRCSTSLRRVAGELDIDLERRFANFQNIAGVWVKQTVAFCAVPEALAVLPVPLFVPVALLAFALARSAAVSSLSRTPIPTRSSNSRSPIPPFTSFFRPPGRAPAFFPAYFKR